MKKILLTLSFFVVYACANAQVSKVQHFYCQSADGSALFALFHQTFGLPVIYDYQTFGNFSSGGLSLGNITFEFVGFEGYAGNQTIFEGIAFEPKQHTDGIIAILDGKQIAHAAPFTATTNVNGEEKPFYTMIDLPDLSAEKRHVFICDYADRDFITYGSAKGDSALKANNGGALGVTGLKRIVIGTTDKAKEAALWANIPGIKKTGDYSFGFAAGPEIFMEKNAENCIKEIVIKVQSKEKAIAFLSPEKYLKMEGSRLLIDPAKINGLRIILEE